MVASAVVVQPTARRGAASELRRSDPFLPSPRRVAMPVTGHDAADRLDLVDDLGQTVLVDLGPHRSRVLAGTRSSDTSGTPQKRGIGQPERAGWAEVGGLEAE